jgi:hypothetical protein
MLSLSKHVGGTPALPGSNAPAVSGNLIAGIR